MVKKLNYNPNEKCTQAIVFARVSSKKQKDKGVSLDVQMETITQYCIDNGLKVIKDLSIDESSTRGERKQYHEMLEFAKNHDGKIAIIVNYVDRLQRSYDDTYELNRLRKEGKIEIHFLKEGLIITKDSAAMDLTFWNMHVLMANFQVNTMIDKVKASQAKNWSLGKCQGYAPLGYLNAKDENYRSTVILDETRAPIITKLFEEYATGNHTIDSIWKLSMTLGLYTKMKSRRGNFVSKNTLYDILTNPFYYGEMCIKGEFMPHIYPPIVSRSLFDKVQEIFAQNGNHNRNNSENQAKYTYAFRGLITCKECGGLITPATAVKKNGTKKINELKNKEDKLLDFYLEGKLTQDIYDIKKVSIDKEIKDLEETKEKYKIFTNDTRDKIVNIFSLAGNISYIFQHASPTRKNELLKMLLQDCQLNGKKLEYTLRKPFDKLINNRNIKSWSNIAVETIEEIC